MKLELAREKDLGKIMEIIQDAQAHLLAQGIDQWQNGYPNEGVILADVACGKAYVMKNQGEIVAYSLLDQDGDADYAQIKGSWHHDGAYLVVHRVAVASQVRGTGVSQALFQAYDRWAREHDLWHFRMDTHHDNKKMQHILRKNGFSYRGDVLVKGAPRMGFEKEIKA